jgi:hypothetical protein
MLEYAKKYEGRLQEMLYDTAFDPFYKWQTATYIEKFSMPDNTYNGNHFVSLYRGEILGLIDYVIRRAENAVWGLGILHFGGERAPYGYTFGKDVMTALKDIFETYHFNKLNYSVVIGNPIEKTYDKLTERYNGRVVGVRRQQSRLMDGMLYDLKEYELLARDYFSRKIQREHSMGVRA